MSNINDVLHQKGVVYDKMTALIDSVEAENRDFNAEEKEVFAKMEGEFDSLSERAKRLEEMQKIESSIDRSIEEIATKRAVESGQPVNAFSKDAYKEAFNEYARKGKAVADSKILNALQVGTDSEGGYIVPTEFETMLVAALQDINEFRNYCNVITTGGDRNIPVESTLGTATWTAEEAAYTESDAAFGQVVLGAHKLGTIIKVSEELLQDSFFDVASYLATNFGKRFGLAEEAAIVSGSGTGQPTGLDASAGTGITAASATAITGDELIDVYHDLGRPYRKNAAWVMNDSTVKLVRKLKDSQGQYLWQPSLQAGQPDMLLGRPVIASDAMSAAASTNVSVLFGDLSYYTIAERSGRVMQRLNELYAANGQVGFRMFERLDGKNTLTAALTKLTQAV